MSLDHDYLARRGLKENETILILGAYDGDFIKKYKKEIIEKNIFVINIEPDYRTYIECLEYINKYLPLNAVALNMIISDYTGRTMFDLMNYTQLSTMRGVESVMPCDVVHSNQLLSMSLDDFLSLYSVDCIFADIEGSELEVFIYSKKVFDVKYIAIASYHIRDGEPTYKKLLEKFPDAIVLEDHEKWDSAVLYYTKRG